MVTTPNDGFAIVPPPDERWQSIIAQAAEAIELHRVLSAYLYRTRCLAIIETPAGNFRLMHLGGQAHIGKYTQLFDSASYTACVEAALKQPPDPMEE